MSNTFIQLALRGKNDWWRYCLGLLFTIATFLTGSVVTLSLFALYLATDGDPATAWIAPSELSPGQLPIVGVSSTLTFAVNNLGFLFFLAGLALSVRLLHMRSLRSLITPAAKINWRRLLQGFCVFFALATAEIALSYWLSPQDFTLIFDPRAFFIFLPVALLLTPMQTTVEELFFRGYLLQGVGSHLGRYAGAIVSSGLFMLLHGANPEVLTQTAWEGTISLLLYYFLVGVFLCWLTLKDRAMELALGVHAANNLATFILITSSNSVLPTPAIFSIKKLEFNLGLPFYAAFSMLLFYLIVFKLMKKPAIAD